ncbi:MAG: ribosome biogenesis GTP-binding protein YihA/YsxC [Chthoniobacter sp.]|nr:ribosome biogenesis GTP-binding protein YihA/YsxC [Chthoniobacter sp.]
MNALAATFQTSAPNIAACPLSDVPEFAFIGRSNVGKSSLLNMLVGAKALAKVSATPGHTQLINFFSLNGGWSVVDLPGYGYAKTARTERDRFQQMIAGYLCGRENLACVFVLIDSRHEPQTIDLEFVHWLLREAVPFALVFSKTDKVTAGRLQKNIELFQAGIAAWCGELPRVFATSAEKRIGRPEILAFISETLERMASGE